MLSEQEKLRIMKKNARKMTFEESGETIHPYTSLPTPKGCREHKYENREDCAGRKFTRCKNCWVFGYVIDPVGKIYG